MGWKIDCSTVNFNLLFYQSSHMTIHPLMIWNCTLKALPFDYVWTLISGIWNPGQSESNRTAHRPLQINKTFEWRNMSSYTKDVHLLMISTFKTCMLWCSAPDWWPINEMSANSHFKLLLIYAPLKPTIGWSLISQEKNLFFAVHPFRNGVWPQFQSSLL